LPGAAPVDVIADAAMPAEHVLQIARDGDLPAPGRQYRAVSIQ